MKLIIFSDSHDSVGGMISLVEKENPDAIIHLGDNLSECLSLSYAYSDIPMYYVLGNHDFSSKHKFESIITINGVNIFLCHGHTKHVHRGVTELLSTAKSENCNIAFYGHTHLPFSEVMDDVLIANPGSITLPRGGYPPSYGILEITEEGSISFEIKFLD